MPLIVRGAIRKNRANWYLDLHWRGIRLRIFTDKDGWPLDSFKRAERLQAHINYEIDHGLFDPRGYVRRELQGLLFENWIAAWLKRKEREVDQGRLSREYLRTLKSYLNRYLLPYFGRKWLRDIHEGMIEDFFLELPVHLSLKTISNIKGILHKLLADAHRRRDIGRLPDCPKIEVNEPQAKWLSLDEQSLILAQIKDQVRRTYFLFLMRMGCRPGEGRALRWENIDWREETVTIRAAMDQEHYRPSTKERDVRVLPLPEEVMAALKTLPRALSGFIFTFRGRPLTRKLVSREWARACQAAGIEVGLYQGTKHSLGHQAVNAGVPLNIIQDYMGHKSQVSTRRYAKTQVGVLRMMHRKEDRK